MDDLAATLESSFAVSYHLNNPNAPHPRLRLYKCKKNGASQEERRNGLIRLQRQHRYDYVNHFRNLVDGIDVNEQDVVEENEDMDWSCAKSIKPPPKTYKNQLMLSEWLVDVPSDLETNWYFVVCPVGKRSLVVTSGGMTRAYTKSGYCVNKFPSCLPGGNRNRFDVKRRDFTILDCIFNDLEKTFYILDIMCWGGHPVFDSETEFRFYWLKSKLDETLEAQRITDENPYRFMPLPYYSCAIDEMKKALWSPMPFSKVDGLLFYHKQTHYTHGPTPLVGWLKVYMAPELLHIDVPDSFMKEQPASYINFDDHMKVALSSKNESHMEVVSDKNVNSNSKRGRRKKKRGKSSKEAMDICEDTQNIKSQDVMEAVNTDS